MSEQLYRMYDADGVLLYVGISKSAIRRMTEHADTQPWWPEVVTIKVETFNCDRAEMMRIEKSVIANEKPLRNVVHNGRSSSSSVLVADNTLSNVNRNHPMVGCWVLTPRPEQLPDHWVASRQGIVIGALSDHELLVDCFSWLFGTITYAEVMHCDSQSRWKVFRDYDMFLEAASRAAEYAQSFDDRRRGAA